MEATVWPSGETSGLLPTARRRSPDPSLAATHTTGLTGPRTNASEACAKPGATRKAASDAAASTHLIHPGTSAMVVAGRTARPTSELGDVSTVGGEGEAADLGPALAAALQLLGDLAGVLPGGPDEDGRAGAGDRRPQRAQRASRVDQLQRARVEIAAARLVDAVGETGGDEVEVGALQAKHQAGGGRDVGDGGAHRDPPGARPAGARGGGGPAGGRAGARAVGSSWGGMTAMPSTPRGGSKRAAEGAPSASLPQITKPPWIAAATLSGGPSRSVARATLPSGERASS